MKGYILAGKQSRILVICLNFRVRVDFGKKQKIVLHFENSLVGIEDVKILADISLEKCQCGWNRLNINGNIFSDKNAHYGVIHKFIETLFLGLSFFLYNFTFRIHNSTQSLGFKTFFFVIQ